jgi:putative oxidoreductase
MARGSSRFTEVGYLLLRVVFGLAFAEHGAQKLFGLIGGTRVHLVSLMGLAGGIELAAGLLVAFGIFPRWAALVASGEMAYAYFTVHAPHGFWPIVNRGELAVLYCVAFLYIAAHGGGRWSVTRD